MPARASYGQGAGGPPDFQTLVDLHYAALYRFAMSLARCETDAADLVQETFLIWANKGHQLLDFSKARSWLFTTLNHRFLESRRHASKFSHVEIGSVEDQLPGLESKQADQLDATTLIKLMGDIHPDYRAAVALFYLEDYSYAHIAEVLQVPLGTVKSRIARGVRQLKGLIRTTAFEREEVEDP